MISQISRVYGLLKLNQFQLDMYEIKRFEAFWSLCIISSESKIGTVK